MKRSLLLVTLALVALPLFATNGYFAHGQGPANKAMAGAGSALPQDPLAATTNPAAIAFVDPGMILELALFNPNRSYTITGMPSGMQGTFGLAPGTVDSSSEVFLMPSLAGTWRPSDRFAFGLSAVAQGGMNTDYRTNTFWGGDHTGVDLAQMFLDASFAWKPAANHSIGLTVRGVYQQFEAQGLQAFAMFSGSPSTLTNNEHDLSYGVGAKIGYYGKLHPDFAVAASWAPKISMSKFDDYSGLFCNQGEFDIPATMTIGLAWNVTDRLTWVADLEQIEYSGVNAVGHPFLPNIMTAPLGMHDGPGFGWEDVTAYKTGVQFAVSQDWTVRAGYSTANQPIPESEVLFNILAPGVVEDHVTAGFSRALPGGNAFHFSLMHALRNSVSGPNPLEVPGQQ
ncbi:MAG TPA: outer membrane protein transport protein, partial [Thermoanaerobaculia bacterium]|nr:outer membrane protein transport protein [Thermoanaerobaculia bacterium]